MPQKKLLYEVSIIRPLVIFLLVVLHAFAFYSGAWDKPDCIGEVPAYFWFCQFVQGFRIETIALIAGYVFAFQSIDLGKKYAFGGFIWKKFKRLIIPCIIFSLAYYFLFLFDRETFQLVPFLINILSGSGHLWFLPMLFWCFLAIWTIDRYRLSSWWLLVLLALASIMPIPYIPFGLHRLPHFLFYCYFGYTLYEHRPQVIGRLMNAKSICLLWGVYILLTIANVLFVVPNLDFTTEPFMTKLGWYMLSGSTKFIISCSGILALYLMVNQLTTREGYVPPTWVIDASKVCYGVYVYHQFMYVWLYDYTMLPQWAGTYWLPWAAFAITITVSYGLTRLTLLTRTGRFLIG